MDRSEHFVDPGTYDLGRVLSEVQSPQFEVAFRGYDPAQVHALLDRVAAALRYAVEGRGVVPQGDRYDARTAAGVLDELVASVAADVHRFREEARAEAMRQSAEAADAAARTVAHAEDQAAALLAAARKAAATTLSCAHFEAAVAQMRAKSEVAAIAAGSDGSPAPGQPDAEGSPTVDVADGEATMAEATPQAAAPAADGADPGAGAGGGEDLASRPPWEESVGPHPRAASR